MIPEKGFMAPPDVQTLFTERFVFTFFNQPPPFLMKTKEELIDWLRDAYAMEKAMEMALQKQIDNDKLPMTTRDRANAHLGETQAHAEAVRNCLHQLGDDTSTLKTMMAQGMEWMKGASVMFAKDEQVKCLLAAYASEHFEVACYTALIAAAKEAQMPEIVDTCESILRDETRMAEHLRQNLGRTVTAYLRGTMDDREEGSSFAAEREESTSRSIGTTTGVTSGRADEELAGDATRVPGVIVAPTPRSVRAAPQRRASPEIERNPEGAHH
jgi:ferritin-like metal-binding protein YciE